MIALWVGVMSTERVLAIMCMAAEMWSSHRLYVITVELFRPRVSPCIFSTFIELYYHALCFTGLPTRAFKWHGIGA